MLFLMHLSNWAELGFNSLADYLLWFENSNRSKESPIVRETYVPHGYKTLSEDHVNLSSGPDLEPKSSTFLSPIKSNNHE